MAWTAPMTAVANAVFTAAQFNTNVRDNLLETMPGKATAAGRFFVSTAPNSIEERVSASAEVLTSQTTTTTTYTDLATSGPAVTVTTGSNALVFIHAQLQSNSATDEARMSYAVSGATTSAATDARAMYTDVAASNENCFGSFQWHSGLTPGSNTFTAKYRSTNAATTATFLRRRIVVIPF